MTLSARRVAELIGGELRGDPTVEVDTVAPLDRAGPRCVSFLGSPKYGAAFAATRAGLVVVAADLADADGPATRIIVGNPYDAVLSLLPHFYDTARPAPGIAPTARLGRNVRLGDGVRIDDYVVVGDGVSIGDHTHLYPHVTVYAGTEIGARCLVHAGVRLGSDGFGYVFRNGAHEKIPHVGRCLIGNDVEIGANSTVDRGSIDDTVVGDGTKIDNLVQIGHNVRIGRLCLLMSQVGVAGSSHIGDGAILAGQVGVGGHVEIGAGVRVAAQGGVFGDIPAGETWSGYPARPHRESLRASAALFKLAGMIRPLERLLETQRERTGAEERT